MIIILIVGCICIALYCVFILGQVVGLKKATRLMEQSFCEQPNDPVVLHYINKKWGGVD
ncbi:hypothetical protein D3C74_303660 [compost metagenome]